MNRTQLCVGLLSAAVIAFQIALLQIFSVTQWHHFAFMVISVALLGFGASGSLMSVARRWFLDRYDIVLPASTLCSAISMTAAVWLTQLPVFRFDSYLLFSELGQVGALFVTCMLLTAPFLFGGLSIGLAFVRHTDRIGSLYAANLVGSAAGGGIGLGLLHLVQPQTVPPLIGLIAVSASLPVIGMAARNWLRAAVGLSLIVTVFFVAIPPTLVPSEYKDLSRILQMPEVSIEQTIPNPQGVLHIAGGPTLRHAPGLSLAYDGEIRPRKAIFRNGDWVGAIPSDTNSLLSWTTESLPYAMRRAKSVLVLGAGTGEAAELAVTRGARRVTAVEAHGALARILERLPGRARSRSTTVKVVNSEPRTFLATDTSRYDLIVLPVVGAFGGTSGLFAVQEQFGLTVEAFETMWNHLTPDGLICVTAWMDYPYRRPLRLLSTLVEAARRQEVGDPAKHLAAIRGWGTVTFVLQRSEIDVWSVAHIRRMSRELLFDPVLIPGIGADERNRFNVVEDNSFFTNVDLLVGGTQELLDSYDFKISPATDDRPYFSQFLRWRHVGRLIDQFGGGRIPFFELGTLIVAVTLAVTFLAAVLVIILPLTRIGWTGRYRSWTLVHFSGIGLGFMIIEMILIQRFTLFFGHPVFAVVAVFTLLLFFAGCGSLFSSRIPAKPSYIAVVAGLVAAGILFYVLLLPWALAVCMGAGIVGKMLVATALIAPLAFGMGIPFPLGLRRLSEVDEAQVPWAWGINGCLSVASTSLAALLAVELGVASTMIVASLAYVVVTVAGSALTSLGRAIPTFSKSQGL